MECYNFLKSSASTNKRCHQIGDDRIKKCSCLYDLKDKETLLTMVVWYMVFWAGLSQVEKKQKWMEWIHISASHEKHNKKQYGIIFPLPLMSSSLAHLDPEDSVPLICRDALCSICNLGRRFIRSVTHKHMKEIIDKRGKTANRQMNEETRQSLHDYFKHLHTQAAPFATRIVREETGMLERDSDTDITHIPPNMTKKNLYGVWCFDRGWKIKYNKRCKGSYSTIKEFTFREHDDHLIVPLFPTGMARKPIVAWCTFTSFWKRHYPKLRIRPRGADTCTDCLIFVNSLRRRAQVPPDDAMPIFDEQQNDDEEIYDDNGETVLLESCDIEKYQDILDKAKLHVIMHEAQREYVNSNISTALIDILLPKSLRRSALTRSMTSELGLGNVKILSSIGRHGPHFCHNSTALMSFKPGGTNIYNSSSIFCNDSIRERFSDKVFRSPFLQVLDLPT